MGRGFCCFCLVLLAAGWASATPQQTLVIDFMVSSGAERSAWYAIIHDFERQNPDIHVIRNEYDPESYKHEFAGRMINEGVDLAFWFAGERLRELALRQRLTPLDPAFVEGRLSRTFSPAALEATRVDGQTYGLPIAYYPWRFFYRKSLFQRLGLSPPARWNDFLALCTKAKAAGIVPVGLADGDGWPAAGWFDLLDLRLNGVDFHRRLLAGEIPFRDPRVRAVYERWKQLLDEHDFLEDAIPKPWIDVMPYLYREKVAMVLMGSFIEARVPPDLADDIGFFPFPSLSDDMADYEDAPLDVLLLPSSGRHHAEAMRFLNFLADERHLDRLNEVTHTYSPLLGAQVPPGEASQIEKRVLDSAAGFAFFLDRDAKQALVKPALDSFQILLAPPHDLDRALSVVSAPTAR